ncbi:MAG TPA: biopolymer transporter ExbD [Pseudomonadales bacterium]|nr:biopolymer transporter ExbD [Pseudomonadales bacterium]
MKFRRRQRNDVTIELVPLVDVVLVLLLFFMVSTTFIRQTELKVALPEAKAEPQQIDNEVVQVAISADGEYAVDGRLLVDNQLPTLMRALSDAVAGDTRKRLVINADADARHQAVVRAMDAAGQLGLIHLSITTRNPDNAH